VLEQELQLELAKYDANVESRAFSFTKDLSLNFGSFGSPDGKSGFSTENLLETPPAVILPGAVPSIFVTDSGNVVRSPGKGKDKGQRSSGRSSTDGGDKEKYPAGGHAAAALATVTAGSAASDDYDDDGASSEERLLREAYGTPLVPKGPKGSSSSQKEGQHASASSHAGLAMLAAVHGAMSPGTSQSPSSSAGAAAGAVELSAVREQLTSERAAAVERAVRKTKNAVQAALHACNVYWQRHVSQERRRTREVLRQRDAYKHAYEALQRKSEEEQGQAGHAS